MQEKTESLSRLLKRLHIVPDSREGDEARKLWTLALKLACPKSFIREVALKDCLELFSAYPGAYAHLVRRLRGCTRTWLLACTIGPDLEDRARELFLSGEAFSGYLLDYFGTWLTDQTMRQEISALKRAGGTFTRRQIPGSTGFQLDSQAVFVELAGPALGIRLTSGNVLIPQKTVTAVLGQAI